MQLPDGLRERPLVAGIDEEARVAHLLGQAADVRRDDGTAEAPRLEVGDVGGAEEGRHHEGQRAAVERGNVLVRHVAEEADLLPEVQLGGEGGERGVLPIAPPRQQQGQAHPVAIPQETQGLEQPGVVLVRPERRRIEDVPRWDLVPSTSALEVRVADLRAQVRGRQVR